MLMVERHTSSTIISVVRQRPTMRPFIAHQPANTTLLTASLRRPIHSLELLDTATKTRSTRPRSKILMVASAMSEPMPLATSPRTSTHSDAAIVIPTINAIGKSKRSILKVDLPSTPTPPTIALKRFAMPSSTLPPTPTMLLAD